MKLIFKKTYFYCSVLLFFIELVIALYVHDRFIRPYFGDVLVVILVYCFARTFFPITVYKGAIGSLLFAFIVELSQYFKLIEILQLQNNAFARNVIGTSFSWHDLLAYTIGFVVIVIVNRLLESKGFRSLMC